MPWLRRRPPGLKRSWRLWKYSPRRLRPDVLEHADRADGVERPVGDVSVVLQADLDPVLQTRLLHPERAQLGLAFGDGDADGLDIVVPGGVHHEAAPATAHVQEPHAGSEGELLADQLVLGVLGGVEPDVGALPERARVGHRRAQHDPVEVVRDVVVVGDGRGVALARVADPAEPGLLRRRRQGLGGVGADGPQQLGDHLGVEGERGVGEERQRGVEVAPEVELAAHIGPGQAELAGGGDEAP